MRPWQKLLPNAWLMPEAEATRPRTPCRTLLGDGSPAGYVMVGIANVCWIFALSKLRCEDEVRCTAGPWALGEEGQGAVLLLSGVQPGLAWPLLAHQPL